MAYEGWESLGVEEGCVRERVSDLNPKARKGYKFKFLPTFFLLKTKVFYITCDLSLANYVFG